MDRLWDVWTRKQAAWGYPTLPDGAPAQPGGTPVKGSPYVQWAREPFLFFIGPDGKPVTGAVAGRYASIGAFNYSYQEGSGEELVPKGLKMLGIAPRRRAILRIRSAAPAEAAPALGVAVTLPSGFTAGTGPAAPILFAKVTLSLPPGSHGTLFNILVHKGDPARAQLVESVSLFGGHAGAHGPLTFTVALSGALAELGGVPAGRPIYFLVAPEGAAHAAAGHGEEQAEIVSVTVEAH